MVKSHDVYGNDTTVGLPASLLVSSRLVSGTGPLQGAAALDIGTGAGNGTVTFTNLRIDAAGLNYQLAVSAEGLGETMGEAFSVSAGVPTHLVFTQEPTDTVAGVVISPAVSVQMKDGFGNDVPSAGVSVSVVLSSGTGLLTGTTSQLTDGNGRVAFGDLMLTVSGSKALTLSSAGLTSALSGSFTILPAAASQLVFTVEPATAAVGAIFGVQPVIVARDQYGNASTVGLPSNLSVAIGLATGTGPLSGTTTLDIGTGAGNGTITCAGLRIDSAGSGKQLSATANGLASGVSSLFTVNKGNQVITFDLIPNKVYGDAPFTLHGSASSGLPVSFNALPSPVSVSGDVVTILGAGSSTLRASQPGDDNWNAALSVFQFFTISRATLTVTADNKARTYFSANPPLTFHYTGFVYGENATVFSGSPILSTTAALSSSVGGNPYPITVAAGTLAAQNYLFNFVNGTLTITPAPLTVTANNKSRVYAASNPALTGSMSGLMNNDTISVSFQTAATPLSAVGSYDIYPVLSDPNGKLVNYQTTTNLGVLAISPVPLQVLISSTSRRYGEANPPFDGLIIGLKNNDNIGAGYVTTATAGSPVGQYAILPVFVDPDGRVGNYSVTTNNGTLTVSPALLTGVAEDQSRLYGQTNPVFTASYSGFVNGENAGIVTGTLVGSTTAGTNSPVGTYTITVAGQSAANYTISYLPGTLTVTPAALLGQVDNRSRAYGQANPAFTVSYSGFVNGENGGVLTGTFVGSTTADESSPVRTYPIVGSGQSAANYTVSYVNGTLTVTACALAVSAESASRIYGEANPTFGGTLVGVRVEDNITVTYTSIATAGSAVGDYAITPVLADPDGKLVNYGVTSVNGTLTITRAPLTVAAANATRGYGAANPELTGAVSGLRNGDLITASYSTAAVVGSPVGPYPIVPNLVDPSGKLGNYTVTSNDGVLTVSAALLTGTVADKSRAYGQANPAFTVSYSGFVNGEDGGVLTGTFVGSTTADESSVVGTYPIVGGGQSAANYTVSYVNGTLTITRAPLTVVAGNASRPYGGADPVLTGTIVGLQNSDNITASYTTSAEVSSPPGNFDIVPVLSDPDGKLPSYSVTLNNGTLTVTKAASSVALTSSGSPALPDMSVTFTATVRPAPPVVGTPSGSVQFKADGVGIGDPVALDDTAKASFAYSQLLHGRHAMTAEYSGDGNFNGSVNEPSLEQVIDTAPAGAGVAAQRYAYGGVHLGVDAILAGFGDPDSDTITLVSAGPASQQGGEVSLHDRWISYIPPPDFTGEDSFSCTAQDIFGLQATATVSISIRTDSDPAQNISSVEQLDDSSWRIRFQGIPGRTYTIEYAADLQPQQWESLGTSTADGTGWFEFIDAGLTGADSRSYRSTYQVSVQTDASTLNLFNFGSAGVQTQTDAVSLCDNTQTIDPMKKATLVAMLGLLGAASSPLLEAQTTETNSFTAINRVIPDGRADGLLDSRTVTSTIGNISSLKVHLKINGEFNGDLYAYLRHVQNNTTNFCVLLNRPGKAADNVPGYDDQGLNVTLLTGGTNGNIHFHGATAPTGALTGDWEPDGRTADPWSVTAGSTRASTLDSFNGVPAAGEWQLFVADLESGGANTLVEWGLEIGGGAYPTIAWANPADIVYGTALGGSQLNATATYNSETVVGTYAYTPAAGSFLGAGNGQTLSVTFTPGDTGKYLPVTKTVAINVTPAPLTIAANPLTKTYGDNNPTLAATVTGTVGTDTINYTLATTAEQFSGVGSYPITVTLGSYPNYNVTPVNSTLTVSAKAATIVADATTKTYGDDNPGLAAVVTGEAVGGAPINYTLSTTAAKFSGVGPYPIKVLLGSNPNYNVTATDSTLAVNVKAATILADAKTKAYGDDNPGLTAAVLGEVVGGAPINYTLSTTAAKFSTVGEYAIAVTLGSNPNYSVNKTDGTLTVNTLAAIIVADAQSKVFGQDNPPLTAVVTGTVNGDTLNYTLTTTVEKLTTVGSYPITVTLGSNPNYRVTKTDSTLAIGQATTASTLASSANPAATGGSVTFTMTVTANSPSTATPEGTVNFRIDGSVAASGTLSGGIATFATSALTHATHTVVAEYGSNGNFVGTTATLTPDQVINSAPVAVADTLERYEAQGVKVRLSTLLANDTDADDGTPTAVVNSTSANGGTVAVHGDWVFYTPNANDTLTADSFTYTVSDGHGGAATGTVTVAVKQVNTMPAETGQNITIVDNHDGSFLILGSGIPTVACQIQYATASEPTWQDLTSGTPAVPVTVTADDTGVFSCIDTPASSTPARVYRSVYRAASPGGLAASRATASK